MYGTKLCKTLVLNKIEDALNKSDKMKELRKNARETIINNYDLSTLLSRHLKWINRNRQ
jgi:phosphopantothenate synthetase